MAYIFCCRTILTILNDSVHSHLKPLVIAVNTTQANNACLDTVLLTLGQLYHIFLDSQYEPDVIRTIHESLEKRWKRTDQEVFILAVVLKPYLCRKCFRSNNIATTEA